jgi:hypothetical protein
MIDQNTPSFDEWVEYCFTRGYREFKNDPDLPKPSDPRESHRFDHIDRLVITDYLIALLNRPVSSPIGTPMTRSVMGYGFSLA